MSKKQLSPQQLRVLQTLWDCDGDYNAVAAKLYIAISTIKSHMTKIYDHLGVNTKMAALIHGVESGLIVLRNRPSRAEVA